MGHLILWVTHNGVIHLNKNKINKKYDTTNFLKIILLIYRFSELLLKYLGKVVAYVRTLN